MARKREVIYILHAVDKATGERRFVSNYPRWIQADADGKTLPIHEHAFIERHSVASW